MYTMICAWRDDEAFDENDISYYNNDSINETIYDSNYEYQNRVYKKILDSINASYSYWKYKTNAYLLQLLNQIQK